jgi:uncharacterized protein (TIGR02391 family)
MKTTIIKDYNTILEAVKGGKKLSEILPSVLILAKQINNQDLVKWTQLELGSYFNSNSALTEDVTVPEYRTVVGQYFGAYKRPLVFEDPGMQFVNQVRMRNSVAELEKLSEENKMLSIQDPSYLQLIRSNLKVDVQYFSFNSTALAGVLDGIRNALIEKLLQLAIEVEGAGQAHNERDHTTTHLALENLHPLVQSVSKSLFNDGYYRQAILDCYILLTNTVKSKAGVYNLDGVPLMQIVFSAKNPIIKISDDPDEQLGFMWMFSGAVMGIRNPKAHKLIEQTDPQRTLEWLSFASVLLRVLDDSQVIKSE